MFYFEGKSIKQEIFLKRKLWLSLGCCFYFCLQGFAAACNSENIFFLKPPNGNTQKIKVCFGWKKQNVHMINSLETWCVLNGPKTNQSV